MAMCMCRDNGRPYAQHTTFKQTGYYVKGIIFFSDTKISIRSVMPYLLV